MMQNTFSVRLNGIGQGEAETVLRNLAKLFNCEPDQVKTLLQSPGHLVKRGVDQETAQRYRQAIEVAGALCEIVPDPEMVPPEKTQGAVTHSVSISKCNHCGAAQDADSRFCTECGLEISRAAPAIGPAPSEASDASADAPKGWWYSIEGQRLGPVSLNALRTALKPGEARSCMVWQEGMAEWQPALSVPALKTALTEPQSTAAQQQSLNTGTQGLEGMVDTLLEHLTVIRDKINVNHAFLGIVGGFCIYAFSLFLSWARIPTGMLARDGGASNGWSEHAYLAIIPLVAALYPVLQKRAVHIRPLLANIALSFLLLIYNNIVNRTTWAKGYLRQIEMGSDLGAGFGLGLLALLTISVCGIAWSLHTTALRND